MASLHRNSTNIKSFSWLIGHTKKSESSGPTSEYISNEYTRWGHTHTHSAGQMAIKNNYDCSNAPTSALQLLTHTHIHSFKDWEGRGHAWQVNDCKGELNTATMRSTSRSTAKGSAAPASCKKTYAKGYAISPSLCLSFSQKCLTSRKRTTTKWPPCELQLHYAAATCNMGRGQLQCVSLY